MKSIIEIPDKVWDLYQKNQNASRRKLSELGISSHEARVMAWVLNKGKIVNDVQSIPNPDEGTVKTLIIADTHFNYEDPKNVDIAINYGLKHGADELILAGDGCDFKAVSYWFSRDLVDIPFEDELENAKEKLRSLSNAFIGKKKIYIAGNHEYRLLSYMCKNAPKLKNIKIGGKKLASVVNVLDLDEIGFKYVDNIELIQNGLSAFHIGKLFVLHGHETSKVGYNTINPAKLYFEKLRTSAVVFHLHRSSEWVVNKPLDHSIEGCWGGGCLCKIHPDYSPINNWMPGFVFVERDSNGYFSLRNLKIVDGRAV